MKNIVLLLAILISVTNSFAGEEDIKSFDHYSKLSCQEMMNPESEDKFIQFATKEITEDLGADFCDKVRAVEVFEDFEYELDGNLEHEVSKFVSPVQYGKLIDGLYDYYLSIQ